MSSRATAKAKADNKTKNRRSHKSEKITMDKTTQKPSTAITVQDKQPGTVSFVEPSIPLPGNRPIATSTLNISDEVSIMGLRPVDSSALEVVGTISAMGERPIAASSIKIWDSITLSGNRPIAVSTLAISETEMIMGNRPIASNLIDNLEDLMGYLD